MPALAGVLIVTAWTMSEPHKLGAHFRRPMEDRVLLVLTLLLTVFADLTIAIGAGVALGLAMRLRRRFVPPAKWSPPER
jgi:SulP family sulfate permease